MAFQVVPVLSSLPMVLQGQALRWSQEVIGTAWHTGVREAKHCIVYSYNHACWSVYSARPCFCTLWSNGVFLSEETFLSVSLTLWINDLRRDKILLYTIPAGEKPWPYKNLSSFLLQSPLGATSYAFTWQIIHISSLGVSSEKPFHGQKKPKSADVAWRMVFS